MDSTNAPTVSISLTAKNTGTALEFYKAAFGAEEIFRLTDPEGNVAHSEFMIGNSRIFLSGESPDWKAFAMPEGTLSSNILCIFSENCDADFERAVAAGAISIQEPKDEFWGMRSCVLADPFGYRWSIGHVVEELTPEEVSKRAEDLFSQGS
ncbi:MAG: VOC family protein [Verrucomicrobiota bacterium]